MTRWAGTRTTRVQCPFCKHQVAWFYRAQRFARHGRPECCARFWRGTQKGAIFNASDARFSGLRYVEPKPSEVSP